MLERVDTRHRWLDILPALGRARPDSCVTGLAACSASLPRKSKHGHTWPPPRARVETVQDRPESFDTTNQNVATEMALHVLAYNLTRVMNTVGIKPLLVAIRA